MRMGSKINSLNRLRTNSHITVSNAGSKNPRRWSKNKHRKVRSHNRLNLSPVMLNPRTKRLPRSKLKIMLQMGRSPNRKLSNQHRAIKLKRKMMESSLLSRLLKDRRRLKLMTHPPSLRKLKINSRKFQKQ